MERLETRLEGPVLFRPMVHGDERGFFLETYRREVYAELGIAEEFVQDNHSRSVRGVAARHALPGRPRQAKLVAARAARSSTCWSTCAAARRRSASGRRSGSTTRTSTDALLPGRLRARVLRVSEHRRRRSTSARLLRRRDRARDRLRRPRGRRSSGRRRELPVSGRDASAPRLRDIADELPFVFERALTASSRQVDTRLTRVGRRARPRVGHSHPRGAPPPPDGPRWFAPGTTDLTFPEAHEPGDRIDLRKARAKPDDSGCHP